MQFKIAIIVFLIIYVFSGKILYSSNELKNNITKDIQEEIIINEGEINVFEKKTLNDIEVKEKRIKAWLVIISYNETNQDEIKNKLDSSGYSVKLNAKKMYYTLGPFSSQDHAREESEKLSKLYGLNNQVINFIF